MTVLFAETPDATQAFEFWTSVTGAVTYDASTATKSGLASWKCDSGAGEAVASLKWTDPVGQSVVKLSVWVRFSDFPDTSDTSFININDFFDGLRLALTISTSGVLGLEDGTGSSVDTGSTFIKDTWHHIVIAQDSGVADDPDVTVYFDESSDIVATNIQDNTSAAESFEIGWLEGSQGANIILNIAHVVINDDADEVNPGDLRVTAKLPLNSGGTNGWDGNIGTPTVDDRPIDEATGHTHAGSDDQVESSDIQAVSVGDVDIDGLTLVGHVGWVWADRGSGGAGSPSILVGDVETGITLTSGTPNLFQDIITSTSYPSGTDQIGMHSTDGSSNTNWYEGGILLVYIAAVEEPATSQAYAFWF